VRPPWPELPPASVHARAIETLIEKRGASFFHELERESGLHREAVEAALAELVARGTASSDSWAGLRALIAPQNERAMAHRGQSPRTPRRRGRTGPPLRSRLPGM